MKLAIFIELVMLLLFTCGVSDVYAQRNTSALIADGWVFDNDTSNPNSLLPDTTCEVECSWATDGIDSMIEGDSALYIGDGASAWYRFADEPLFGQISFHVYDKGASFPKISDIFGPRWGVQNNPHPNPIPNTGTVYDQMMGVEITATASFDANASYAFINSSIDETSSNPSHLTINWPGQYDGPGNGQHAARRVAGSLPQGATAYDPADNVQGAWSRWTFAIHDGEDMLFTVSDPDGSNKQSWTVIPALDSHFDTGFSTKGFNQVFFYGGNTSGSGTEDHVGLWIDDIHFIADPGHRGSDWSENFNGADCPSACGDDCPPPPPYCPEMASKGDFNCDTHVGLLDLDILGQNWGATGYGIIMGDGNMDGEVGLLDLDILMQNWGATVDWSSGYIPEPTALTFLAITSLVYLRRR